VGFKVTGIRFMAVFITRRDAACFLAMFTKILPLYLPKKGRLTANSQLLCLMAVEAAKLAQAAFGDFLADARVSRLRGSVKAIKRCIGRYNL
jgi:hypothetical protein